MNRIIVALDGSELSERALEPGQLLARTFDGTLELVHVLEDPILMNVVPSVVVPNRLDAERYLRSVAARLPEDLSVSSYALWGNAVEQLLTLTNHEPHTVLVMSSHGRGGLSRIMYGSVVDKVMRAATVPVALVRASAPLHSTRLKTIVVPLDGSKLAEESVSLATAIAERSSAILQLVRVIDPIWRAPYVAYAPEMTVGDTGLLSEIEQQTRDEAQQYLESVAATLSERDVPVELAVRIGQPVAEILRLADSIDADLIVLSTHGHGGIYRWAFGSVTNELLHRGVTPILVIPPKMSVEDVHSFDRVVAEVR